MNEEEKKVAEEEQQPESPVSEPADRAQMRRYVKVPSKYEGRCNGCKGMIRVGEPLVWDTYERKTYCAECGLELMEAQGGDEEDD